MVTCRLSWLAIVSIVLNVPWMVALGWCVWAIQKADHPVAGEIFLLPLMAWFFTGILAGVCGLAAWVQIRKSDRRLRGRWLACIGMLLAAVLPMLGVAENIWGTIRQNQINRPAPEPMTGEPLPRPRQID
jgi:hypothetical protein